MKRYEHTKKFAKHIVAPTIKEQKKLLDEELAEFIAVNPIGRCLVTKGNPQNLLKSKKQI